MSEGAPCTDKCQQFSPPITEASEAVLIGHPQGPQVVEACLD